MVDRVKKIQLDFHLDISPLTQRLLHFKNEEVERKKKVFERLKEVQLNFLKPRVLIDLDD